jgi:hypothetical protein
VPAGATTGRITVEVGGQIGSSAGNFTVSPPNSPTISDVDPPAAAVGASVTITGTNFSTTPADNIVKFNGVTATIAGTPTATSIATNVPAGATTGKVTVEVGGQTATSANDFTVLATGAAAIISESAPASYDKGGTLTVSITVSDAANVNSVSFRSRGISEAASSLKSDAVAANGNKYEKVIAASDLTDPLGLFFYFEVTDKQSVPAVVTGASHRAYVRYPATSAAQVIPGLKFGNQVSDYQIISVPLTLDNPAVSSVFSALMPYDKKKWRLFTYATGDNREYNAFSNIDPGKGYWLIVKSQITINPGAGQVVAAHDAAPFAIVLSTGWNLIGNPFNFDVSWADVMAANVGVLPAATKPQVFADGALKDGTVLEKYRGAFVFSANPSPVTLNIPATKTIAGRVKGSPIKENHLDENEWEVKLNLRNGGLSNELGGVGMHPKATLGGMDEFDLVSVPLPDGLALFGLAIPHPELNATFSKEVVPTHENFTWEFDVVRSSSAPLELTWENYYFGDNDKELMLFDPSTLEVVNMRTANRYHLSGYTTKLRILFGSSDYVWRALDAEVPLIGTPYPNPASNEVTIPFRVPQASSGVNVTINIYNSHGAQVGTVLNREMDNGRYEAKWYPDLPPGLYLVRMQVGPQEIRTTKLIIK